MVKWLEPYHGALTGALLFDINQCPPSKAVFEAVFSLLMHELNETFPDDILLVRLNYYDLMAMPKVGDED